MAEVSIRSAAAGDLRFLVDSIRRMALELEHHDQVIVTEQSLGEQLFGKRAAAEAIVGEVEAKPVAYAVFFQTFSSALGRPGMHIDDLYVLPEARDRGIGEVMMRHLAALARERGYGRVEWWAQSWNTSALRFYERIGASILPNYVVLRLEP